MVRARPSLPAGHGEVLARPAFDMWAPLAEKNRSDAAQWRFEVGGVEATRLRELAHRELTGLAAQYSERLRLPLRPPVADAPVVMTGHQPEFFHPGVWVKDFFLQRLADETGSTAIDLVVDSDRFDSVSVHTPCLIPETQHCREDLATGGADACFFSTPVPDRERIDGFCEVVDAALSTLPSPAVRRHFSDFCTALRAVGADAGNIGELVTIARRRFEAQAQTDYFELPVTVLAGSEAFARFVVDIVASARRFAETYNEELARYRAANKIRSAAQPFPDLAVEGGRVELPLWAIDECGRRSVFVEDVATGRRLQTADRTLAVLPPDPAEAVATLLGAGVLLAPRALALTLFARVFCCDLFVHGVGGGRYDCVTDAVCRRYYGVEPPGFAVASLTMYLPLGAHIVGDAEVGEARERINRLEHNPDALLGEAEFDSEEERELAFALAAEKTRLVETIAAPDADRKALGARIREVNRRLSTLLEPLRAGYVAELEWLESQARASAVLTDRTYPFCLWSPHEVADKVR